MNKLSAANKVAIVIGLMSFGFGIYLLVKGASFERYSSPVFLGITLAGVGYINFKKDEYL